MSELHLVIGNKTYSSWSLRPWLALKIAGLPFRETVIALDMPETKGLIAEHSKAGRVPILHHGDLTVWESLAILEYLAETFPDRHLWPEDKAARARARAVSNEMHAGFSALRNACPMNLRRARKAVVLPDAVKADIARIEDIWRTCRVAYGQGGPFLFGRFTNADAMFAPIATRFDTYDVPVADDTRAYMRAILTPPAFADWKAAALKETWILAADEVD